MSGEGRGCRGARESSSKARSTTYTTDSLDRKACSATRKRRLISSNGFGNSRRATDSLFSLGLCSQTTITQRCGPLPCRFPERCNFSSEDSAGISTGVGECGHRRTRTPIPTKTDTCPTNVDTRPMKKDTITTNPSKYPFRSIRCPFSLELLSAFARIRVPFASGSVLDRAMSKAAIKRLNEVPVAIQES